MILFIKHIDIEGPGTIETFINERGLPSRTIALHEGEQLPKDLAGLDAIVSLGGPMNVDEEEKYPFLKQEDQFLKKAIEQSVPVLGICLGSQLLAKAAGAKVVKSPVKEVGWFKTSLTSAGQQDPLFVGLSREIDVYHWHEDMWELPVSGQLLATSSGCPHQALKVGNNAYGLQFHIEITDAIIRDWCQRYFSSSDLNLHQQAQEMLFRYAQKQAAFNAAAYQIYDNFLKIAATGKI